MTERHTLPSRETESDELRRKFEEILAPAVNPKAPYAKVMIGMLVEAARARPIHAAAEFCEHSGARLTPRPPAAEQARDFYDRPPVRGAGATVTSEIIDEKKDR